jgi:RHS repeat-associated protein
MSSASNQKRVRLLLLSLLLVALPTLAGGGGMRREGRESAPAGLPVLPAGTVLGSGQRAARNGAGSPTVEEDLVHLTTLTQTPAAPPYIDGPAAGFSGAVNVLTGYLEIGVTDLAVPAKGLGLAVMRAYSSYNGVTNTDGQFGFGWAWGYGTKAITAMNGDVTILEGNGRRAQFTKAGSTYTAGPGVNATLAAVMGGGYTLTRHNQHVWTFNADGTLAAIRDRNGNTQTLAYTAGKLSAVSTPGGRTLTITTNAQGRITAIAGPGGLSTAYTYTAAGDLATATDAAGAVTTYTYDASHQLLTVVDARGDTPVKSTYTTLGRISSQQLGGTPDPRGGPVTYLATLSYAYDPTAVTVTDPRGDTIRYSNDGAGRLTAREVVQTDPRTMMTTVLHRLAWTYNANSDVLSHTDANGRLHTATYDSRANPLTRTADAGMGGLALTTTFTYNMTNDLLTVTDPLNHTTSYSYDVNGNQLTVRDALNNTTISTYDSSGQRTSVTDATSRQTTFTYASNGDLLTMTVGAGTMQAATTTYTYNAAGRRTAVTDALNHTTTYTVDGMGRVTAVTNALGHTASYTFDGVGNRTRVTDPLNRQTNYAFDALNRLVLVTDALFGQTSYTYDPNSNRLTTTNALGKTWTDTYDILNRRATSADPLGNTTEYTYDLNGNLTQVKKPDMTVNRYVYDTVNRRTGIDLQNNGTLDHQFTYDAASRRTSVIDGVGPFPPPPTTTFTYDTANRLTSVTAPDTGTVSYGYDGAGRRTSLTYPYPGGLHQVTYAYTSRGELSTVTDWLNNVTSYGYDLAGRRTSLTLPGHLAGGYTYDNANRLTGIVHPYTLLTGGAVTLGLTYVYDNAGNRTQITDTQAGGTQITNFAYDALNRLTAATYPNGDMLSYGYDAVGNRTSQTTNGMMVTNTFDLANRMTASGSDTYTFDANGNQTGQTVGGVMTSFSYDALDRLTAIGGPTPATYVYNGLNLRVSKTVGMTTTRFAWDLAMSTPVLLSDGASTEYIYGHELIGQVVTSGGMGTATYAHADVLGSVRLVTDGTGTEAGTAQYDAFGTVRSQTGVQLPFGFTGEQRDAESGLIYLRARFYDPKTGRFLTRDPVRGSVTRPASQHSYVYANNNPLRWSDPSGREACSVGGLLGLGNPFQQGGGGGGRCGLGAGGGGGVIIVTIIVAINGIQHVFSVIGDDDDDIEEELESLGRQFGFDPHGPRVERMRDPRGAGQASDRVVDAMAQRYGLTEKEREELKNAIEEESRGGGGRITAARVRELAEDIVRARGGNTPPFPNSPAPTEQTAPIDWP